MYTGYKNENPRIWGFVSVEGLEPSTNDLKGHCSAIELHAPGKTHVHSITIV